MDRATSIFLDQGHEVSDIKAVGLTNQRETVVVWDTQTGEPLYNAIAWPDTRTKGMVRDLKSRQGADKLQDLCGLPLSTYPSSVKLLWLLEHVDEVKKAYDEDRLSFGTIDTWIIYNLNGGKDKDIHVTDASNASRTMFMNLHTLQYDDQLLDFFRLDRKKMNLPKIVPSSSPDAFGQITKGELQGVRIAGCLGDQSSALVGQQGFTPGSAKNTYGTGCFLLYNVGEKPVISRHGLLATVAYDFGGKRKPVYALEGSIAVAGSGVKFLMNNLGFITHSHKISDLAASVEDNGGCVFVTAFSGLFAPYWIDDAKGTIFGITQFTERGHIARATLEATCFQTKAILDAMELDSGHKLNMLAVDGGMSNSNLCMQVGVAIRNCMTPLILITPNRPKQISSVSQWIDQQCARRQPWVQLSQLALLSTFGKSSMNSRVLIRKTAWSSNQTSAKRKAPKCSRSGVGPYKCVRAGLPTNQMASFRNPYI
jgi:glycerol kinase